MANGRNSIHSLEWLLRHERRFMAIREEFRIPFRTGFAPVWSNAPPVLVNEVEFDAFINGDAAALVACFRQNRDFEQWFNDAGYKLAFPPQPLRFDDKETREYHFPGLQEYIVEALSLIHI